ncbi:FixH family protein [Rhodosalinus sp. FB01]|uniref:FixH family protein n=1 Tax=Rhodosalinus sp. FB01 TaxID=3239194 RepID=UPI0035246758
MKPEREFTGRHALAIFVGAFTIIIGVNLALAWNAVSTFPGLEVKNSYVASPNFDARREAQEALGGDVSAAFEDETLVLSGRDAEGRPVQLGQLETTVGRATHVRDDFTPEFSFDGRDYVARTSLASGVWNLRMRAQALDGTPFEQRIEIYVRG